MAKQDWVSRIIRIGNSYGVILPIDYLRYLKMNNTKQWIKISINQRTKNIIITKVKKPKI